MTIEFSKYQGLGNDFLLIDNRDQTELKLTPEAVQKWCDRHFGVGADGVIFLCKTPTGDYQMRIINSDGTEPEMCGNGIRCLAKFMQDIGIPAQDNRYQIKTGAGWIVPEFCPGGEIAVDMGEPRLSGGQIPTTLGDPNQPVINVPLSVAGQEWRVTLVSMGNPHCVVFVEEVAQIPYTQIGREFEHHPVFPARINTEFVQVIDRQYLKMRVWERGAGATLACGTGACASVVAGVLNNYCDRSAVVELLGGKLRIHWSETTNRLTMTGKAEFVFRGWL
ncbi:MAG: diaminopimelate epimerase [Pseudanabaenaceae cyanobacterium]